MNKLWPVLNRKKRWVFKAIMNVIPHCDRNLEVDKSKSKEENATVTS